MLPLVTSGAMLCPLMRVLRATGEPGRPTLLRTVMLVPPLPAPARALVHEADSGLQAPL
jgi:hypothetical protein